VTLVVVVAALATGVVLVSGGVRQFAHLRVRGIRLLIIAAWFQVAPALLAPTSQVLHMAGWAASLTMVALCLLGNIRVAGVPLIATGLLANALVIVANGAMPISVDAAERIGISTARLDLEADPLREPLTRTTNLTALGDVVPVALPWAPQVVSPGDVLVASGVALMLIAGPRRRPIDIRHRERRAQTDAQELEGEMRVIASASESTTRGSYS
jgi:hypothetical protein